MTTQRSQLFDTLKSEKFDLLVIGGGITGAGIALDAASRGMKTALIEKNDFASGTSSKSTKLIHGGLRYLKQFEVGLVREVGKERAIVHRLAPHLVKAEKMLLPIYKNGTYGMLGTSVGLWVYDKLAGVTGEDSRRMLSREKTLAEEPLLKTPDLLGGGLYAEYRTDDARLTLSVIKAAISYHAVCLNYLKCLSFEYRNGKISSANCRNEITGENLSVTADFIVSAAGPWVDEIRKADHSLEGKHLFLSKGSHIVVARERLPLKHSVYFDLPDGRMMFGIPRHRTTYLGTTDTPFDGDTDHVFADAADVDYLLAGTNNMFPGVNLNRQDVESTWAGLRPLIHEEGKSAGEMSRKDEIFESESGLISIAGGKLTGYRKMAERIVDLVSERSVKLGGRDFGKCRTDEIPLSGDSLRNAKEVAVFQKEIQSKVREMNLPAHYPAYLVETYGEPARQIIRKAFAYELPAEQAILRAELSYCFAREMVLFPDDFLERRTGRLYFDIGSIDRHLDFILLEFRNYFNWSTEKLSAEKQRMETLLQNVRNF